MTTMNPVGGTRRAAIEFADARIAAEQAGVVQQRAAARRVAERSHDVVDCRELLAMLGLTENARFAVREA